VARFKDKRTFFFPILIITCLLIIIPIRENILDILKLPLTICSLTLKEIRNFLSYRAILNENILLKRRFDNLQREYIKLKEEISNFERMKALFSFKEEQEIKAELCKVIGREPSNWYSSILIDKGRSHRIKKGDCVIDQKGLVGRVSEVGKNTAKVTLITDPYFSCAGIVQRSRSQGIVYGSLLNKLIMRYFDDLIDVKPGDIVITSNLSTFVPKGILIGEIVSVESDSTGTRAVISPSAELQRLEEVLVILND
jgi:rod shape-determining protein MreC